MRRFGWITLFVLTAFALAVTLFKPQVTLADTQTLTQRTLDVTGKGTLTVKYDTASITLGFTQLKDTATDAYSTMGDAMDKVATAMKDAGIKEDDMKTGTFTLNEEWDYTKDGRVFKGYRVNNTLIITTHDLTKVAGLIQQAVAAGANSLQGVNFSIKDTDALVDQALDLAVDDAKAKADRVAGRLGAKVVGVIRINVQDNGRGPVPYAADMSYAAEAKMAAAAPAPVYSGTTDYTATVSVTFEIQ